jgi:hypothetical protein
MSVRRDAQIEAWQKSAGIEPATGARAEALHEMSRLAYKLIEIIALERSGVRDGDGYWSGADVLGDTVGDLNKHYQFVTGQPAMSHREDRETYPGATDAEIEELFGDNHPF